MEQVDTEIEKQHEAGETDVDPENAKMVTGTIAGVFAGRFRDAWGWGIAGGAIDIQKINIASAMIGRRFNQRA